MLLLYYQQGKIVKNCKSLYLLNSSVAAWHTYLANSLMDRGFGPSFEKFNDPYVWMQALKRSFGRPYIKYLLVYVYNIIIITEEAITILRQIKEFYG